MSHYKYVLFDWNGTIIDDLQANIEIENHLLKERGLLPLPSKEFYLENFGFPIKAFYEKCGFDFSKESYFDIAEEYAELFREQLKKIKLFSDVLPMLESLKARGCKLVIISASEHSFLQKQVDDFSISQYFEKIIGSENKLGKSKVQAALDWFETKNIEASDVLFVGDTVHDFETAKSIGCDCFLVSRGHNSKRRLKETGCEVFESLKEITQRLCKKMKKVIIAPDSFKGTISATEVCSIISSVLKEKYSDCETISIPIADGGEGTADAYQSIFGGERIYEKVKSPLSNDIEAYYVMLPDGTAVIEMAAASGITIEKKNNALLASTYGTGQLIKSALDKGAKKIILGLGGSATTDGGVGCVMALGGKFLDENANNIPLGGIGLEKLEKIDLSGLDERIAETNLTVLCDVTNPLYGESGAAFVYSRQKGASDEDIIRLDNALKSLADVSKETLGKDYSSVSGAGAAGGMGFAVSAFLGGRLQSGIDCILEAADFEEKAKTADLVITGEGKMDMQSLMGKAPFGVAKRSGNTKVIAVVGLFDADREEAKELGISEIIETNYLHLPFEQIKGRAKEDLKIAAEKIEI